MTFTPYTLPPVLLMASECTLSGGPSVDVAVVAAFAAAIAAVVGPIIAVVIANRFTRHESTRQEASRVFRQVMVDAQNYRHAFLDQHRFHTNIACYPDKLNQLREAVAKTVNATDSEGRTIHANAKASYDYSVGDLAQLQERFHRAFRETRSLEAALNADVLSLGLLFDKQSEACGRAVQSLIAMSEVFSREPLPAFSECQERLNSLITIIGEGLKGLQHLMQKSHSRKGIGSAPLSPSKGGS
jgi:hypothetical protein